MVDQIGKGRRILVIEDDSAVRTLVERVLAAYGFEVLVAHDGLDGLLKLEGDALPHLIIADVMMPRLDGMSLVKALKSRPETKSIPVIFLTAKTDPKTMIEGINVGAKFYVTKPFQIDELVGKVQKALGG